MNSTTTRRTAATVAMASTAAAALTAVSAVAPTAASAQQADAFPVAATHGAASGGDVDIALEVAHRKAAAAQYYVDHALELYQQAAG
jgi:hypothetical protein